MQQSVIQPANQHVFEVSEVIQGNTYTYLKVKENMMERWVAIGKRDINKGDVLYYDEALQMTDFHSKEIDRTFDVIYFVNEVSKTPMNLNSGSMGQMPAGHPGSDGHTGKAKAQNAEVEMEKNEGELTIADIFESRSDYAKQEFEIRGIVVKVNEKVMGKNWVHIQDGTESDGQFDLTITTQDEVKVGDEVIFKGKLTLEKDFGAGYFYDVIVEEATLVSKKVS